MQIGVVFCIQIIQKSINTIMDPFIVSLAEFLGIPIETEEDLEDVEIQSLNPSSSAINEAYYDPETKTLYITFVSGSSYQYENVSRQRWNAFKNASSTGRYFVNRIRENYIYSKGVL
jgi:hypothetical protein